MVGERLAEAVYFMGEAVNELNSLMDELDMAGVDNFTSTDVALVYSRLQDLITDLEAIADDV